MKIEKIKFKIFLLNIFLFFNCLNFSKKFTKFDFKIGKKNYYDISHKDTLANITVVLQETELFNLSLCENITMNHSIYIPE